MITATTRRTTDAQSSRRPRRVSLARRTGTRDDAAAGRIGHVQIADAPGRHQPGTGELPIARWVERIFATGYDGWVACEYKPEGPSADSFGWLEGLR